MAYLKEERETTINFDDVGETATIYTCNARWMTKMRKLQERFPEIYIEIRREGNNSITYEFPKELVSIRAPKQKQKELTPEEKERRRVAFIERTRKAREKKNGN